MHMICYHSQNMKRFYLIRHGEKEKFAGDPGLTAIGMQQELG